MSFHVNVAELGVLSWRLDADNYEADEELKKIRAERGYSYVVCEKASFLFSIFHFSVSAFSQSILSILLKMKKWKRNRNIVYVRQSFSVLV